MRLSTVIADISPLISLQPKLVVLCWSGSNSVNLVLKVVDALRRNAGRINPLGNVSMRMRSNLKTSPQMPSFSMVEATRGVSK
jgi:hypothetical protein